MSEQRIAAPEESTPPSTARPAPRARWFVVAAAGLFLILATPVLIHGEPLADDYLVCMRPVNEGYRPYLSQIWRDTGVVRPARFLELFLISKTCRIVPFGVVILAPLSLKFLVALLLLGLLRDMKMPSPWPEIGTALWFLEPVGTEAALWPSALHVLLGLALALLALRLYRRDRIVWASLAALGACLSVEQVIFALPLAVWLTSDKDQRRRTTLAALGVVTAVFIAYALWPGTNPRQAVTLEGRFHNALDKGEWYLLFPAAGLGLYSGALAFLWAFPYSLAAVIGGAAGGAMAIPRLLSGHSMPPLDRAIAARSVLRVAILVILVNLPLIVTEVGYSARTFTPTWLVLSTAAAAGGARIDWKRTRLLGILGGVFAAFAVLSLALSVSVRVRTAEFDRAAAWWIADRVPNDAVVAVCNVQRTVVEPAPLGAFHLHEFQTQWPSWIQYYTERRVKIRRSGLKYWGSRCPDLQGADLVIDFPRLVRELTGP
jgi:hypothetical protein